MSKIEKVKKMRDKIEGLTPEEQDYEAMIADIKPEFQTTPENRGQMMICPQADTCKINYCSLHKKPHYKSPVFSCSGDGFCPACVPVTTPENGLLLSDDKLYAIKQCQPDGDLSCTSDIANCQLCRDREVAKKQLSHCKPLIEAQTREKTLTTVTVVYGKYIKLLEDELDELVGLAASHGWKSTRYEQGVKCREKIAQLKSGKPIEE